MKTETKNATVQGSLTGKSIKMGVRKEDMNQIMVILTDIYSDSLTAVVREYSCNAIDAHREAGTDLPIEVFLPSRFTPALRIRDYGVGMDADTIEEVYAQYGRSTKRESNDQIGGFGIGCKSALSYTDQFTVTSVKDGYKVIVLVSRDEDNNGQMEIMNMPPNLTEEEAAAWKGEETQEGNGTEVSVAVRAADVHRIRLIVDKFFAYWERGTVLVDGITPKHFTERPHVRKVTDNIYIDESQSPHEDRLIMGGVPYPPVVQIKRPQSGYGYPTYSIIAFVPIGDCAPHPSREALLDTSKTKQTIQQVTYDLKAGLAKAMQDEINKATTHAEALEAMVRWRRYDPSSTGKLTFKGDTLPDKWVPTARHLSDSGHTPSVNMVRVTNRSPYDKPSTTRTAHSIDPKNWPGIVWVTGYEPAKFTAAHKAKLWLWAQQKEIGFKRTKTLDRDGNEIDMLDADGKPHYTEDNKVTHFVLLRGDDKPDSPFIAKERFVSWDEIKDIKVPRPKSATSTGRTRRISGAFDVYFHEGFKSQIQADTFDVKKPLLYIVGNRWVAERWWRALQPLEPEFTLVFMGTNRVAKFERDFPKAEPVAAYVETKIKAWVAKQNKEDIEAWTLHRQNLTSYYNRLDKTRVDDPEIRKMIDLANRPIQSFTAQVHSLTRNHRISAMFNTDISNPLDNYNLWNGSYATDEVYIYLNAVYAARKSGKLK